MCTKFDIYVFILLSLGRYLCWWTSQWVDTSAGELLVPEGIIRLQSVLLSLGRYLCWWTSHWVDTSAGGLVTGSIPLLVDYQSPRVSSACSQCFYHWVDTSADGLLVPEGIICLQSVLLSLGRYLCWWTISPRGYHPPVVSASITGSIPLLVDYQSPRVSSACSQCFYHWVDTSADGLLVHIVLFVG